MFGFLFVDALRDNLRFRRLWPWLLLAGFCFLVAFFWREWGFRPRPDRVYSLVSLTLVFKVLALASAIYSTSVIGREVEQRTIVYLLTRPVPRWMIILSRFLASSIVVTLIGVLSVIGVSLAAYRGEAFANEMLWRDMGALAVGAFAYGALFVLISLMVNRAMLVCLLYTFGWELLVPNLKGDAAALSVFNYLEAIANHPEVSQRRNLLTFLSGQLAGESVTPMGAFMTMAIAVAILAFAACWWFSNFEYLPRDDAA
ncbi:MAG TPA: ABC transporter permease [Fimbriimonadaceae bacterium]|nr:ABC transporter permease [Fimbriimonadaceae bacterium]HRJ96027.1 ABC transporter permease [Fimbriimonadaceae bacterium]